MTPHKTLIAPLLASLLLGTGTLALARWPATPPRRRSGPRRPATTA